MSSEFVDAAALRRYEAGFEILKDFMILINYQKMMSAEADTSEIARIIVTVRLQGQRHDKRIEIALLIIDYVANYNPESFKTPTEL